MSCVCARLYINKQHTYILHTCIPYLTLPCPPCPCLALHTKILSLSLSLSRSLSLRDLLKLLHWDWRRALVHGVKGADLLQGPFVLEEIERFEVARICDLERVGA